MDAELVVSTGAFILAQFFQPRYCHSYLGLTAILSAHAHLGKVGPIARFNSMSELTCRSPQDVLRLLRLR